MRQTQEEWDRVRVPLLLWSQDRRLPMVREHEGWLPSDHTSLRADRMLGSAFALNEVATTELRGDGGEMSYQITTQKQLREEFWSMFPELTCRTNRKGNPLPQNDQPADTRVAFIDWIDQLERNGDISESLAQRATL